MTPFTDPQVQATFNQYPAHCQHSLLAIRELIFSIAKEQPSIGGLNESLKWGQPSYATSKKAGSPFRLGLTDTQDIAIFFHCQTTLVETFRGLFSDRLTFTGNRGIILAPKDPLPIAELTFCIKAALTYHKQNTASS
ncbi:DUF1801 domain-containing protein [Vagococcus sp. BWB3-3]|uniref:DUF1801 domain-containing protein n=1 Tax=Vagococcus allomyrinae TaxID=2794353 RepID=A0A940SVU4_9ENTE|nr:DUF1801 domain-containing protein [Vagococcus allomyrinae]MBP1040693.1 DUF1801 domain-containing protein [Vagococcus allomyrinae]